MLGYPLVVGIIFVDGQELINPTISYGDAFVLIIGVQLLLGGLLVLK